MADEWVSMRVTLPNDPKVISMADFLAARPDFQKSIFGPFGVDCQQTAYERIARNVVVALCVTGLMRVWGMANERGQEDGNDYFLDHADLNTLDEMAGLPAFGEAMSRVRWVRQETRGDVSRVRFPNFLDYNTARTDRIDREERKRERNRERQKRWRERHKGENSNAPHVTRNNANNAHYRTEQDRTVTATASAPCIERGMQGGEDLANSAPDPEIGKTRAKESRSLARVKPDRKFIADPVPVGFLSALDAIVGILQLGADADHYLDQIGFLAQLAYADAAGFQWPPDRRGQERVLWDFIGPAKRKASPAAWLRKSISEDLGPERWQAFLDAYPSPAHCQWLMKQLAAGEISEG